jgi:uncharacterized membrane protein
MKLGTNSAVFILFFGIALIEAVQLKNWFVALIFIFLGVLSIFSDSKKK